MIAQAFGARSSQPSPALHACVISVYQCLSLLSQGFLAARAQRSNFLALERVILRHPVALPSQTERFQAGFNLWKLPRWSFGWWWRFPQG
jgi:hypothetical protein